MISCRARPARAIVGSLVLSLAAACAGSSAVDASGAPLKDAVLVEIAPNRMPFRSFGQVALLAVGEAASLHARGLIYGPTYRGIPSYDSVGVDQTVIWTSRSPQIATINSDGVVTGRSPGLAIVVAQSRGGVATDSAVVVVQRPTLQLATLVPGSPMCGLANDGVAWCWGDNASVATTPTVSIVAGSRFPAFQSGGTKRYVSLSTSGSAVCGIATDGITYCWDNAIYGGVSGRNNPVPISTDLRFTTIRLSGRNGCGLIADGALYCWGDNFYGQLGDGTKVGRSQPVPVTGDLRFTAFTTGDHSCGLSVGGGLYCWGLLGTEYSSPTTIPTAVPSSATFVDIQGDDSHTCGRTSAGEVHCLGTNLYGELGDGTQLPHFTPRRVLGSYAFSSLTVGGGSTCGLTSDGRAICWGANTGNVREPTPTASNLRFTSISPLASGRICGRSSGVYYCWGANFDGTMGVNLMENVPVPTKIAGLIP